MVTTHGKNSNDPRTDRQTDILCKIKDHEKQGSIVSTPGSKVHDEEKLALSKRTFQFVSIAEDYR